MAVPASDLLTIGEVSRRSDLSVATIRYYEERGLLASVRTGGNQRRFSRHVLRRLAVIAAGQRVGLSLERIAEFIGALPDDAAPTKRDWERLGRQWDAEVAGRIAVLEGLRSTLGECIGCGCLSLRRCALFNPGDEAAAEGAGSRWVRRADAGSGS